MRSMLPYAWCAGVEGIDADICTSLSFHMPFSSSDPSLSVVTVTREHVVHKLSWWLDIRARKSFMLTYATRRCKP